jgi:predicted phage baseplate assembly protein
MTLWWGKGVDPQLAVDAAEARLDSDRGGVTHVLPAIADVDPAVIRTAIDGRREGFTLEWTSRRPDDAGVALVAVYAEQHAVLGGVVERLPTKARVEHLRAAGVLQRAPRPLVAMLSFEVSSSAPGGVLVGAGFEVLGRDDTGALIPFETERAIYAQPATLAVLGRRTSGSVTSLTIPPPDLTGSVYPFGIAPAPGVAMYLGLDAEVALGPELTFGVVITPSGEPTTSSNGGLFPPPGLEPPRLAWELFDGRKFAPIEVILDETESFTQSGLIQLELPNGWRPGTPLGTDPSQPLYWLRAQLLAGAWPKSPSLAFLGLNLVRARSGSTIRDEIVETPISPDPAVRRVLRLSRAPVLDGTLDVRIDEGGTELDAWQAVTDLSQAGPDDRKFRFDPATGTLTFADERTGHGKPLPEGFRHVRATYRLATTAARVAAGTISTLAGAASFLSSVTNLDPASGGAEVEALDAALLRGPRAIRARGRAVAVADYEVLAMAAPGADIRRALAVVVGVFVVGNARDDGGPPVPTDATLRAVSEHLASVAPRGAEVVTVAPVFREARVEASIELRGAADPTATARALSLAFDRWFDPVIGGSGEGWPFGGTIQYNALIRFALSSVRDVVAIPKLVLVVDGVRSRHCADVSIAAHDLLWPAPHEIVIVGRLP